METNAVIAGRYRLIQLAGVGGMGAVYRARDEQCGRDVAVKLVARHLAADELAIQRFRREGRLCARLRHPHVVAGLCVGHDSDTVGDYIVTEFVDGDDARSLLGRPVPTADAVAIAVQICDALTYVHDQGIIHGDVSAANILIGRTDRTAKLADFGIARQAGPAAPAAPGGPLRGAPYYLAPEVALGGQATFRADLYSLGVVTRRLLSGDPAPALADAVARATAADPSLRQGSMREFRADLAAHGRAALRAA
jgi:serine/threonine protein kinase